ncbi:hypothetical protein [Ornithinibacillus sp. 179-J 7C1 HS]|uniref:hypothetical protein n=1 Tax=Ornithinibacillus sp. 179-J 7C1 HS TaxID=3142384 RepID=UPI00399F7737
MSRGKIFLLILLLTTIIYSVMFVINVTAEPKFITEATLSHVDKEIIDPYKQFSDNPNLTVEDVRQLSIQVEVKKNWSMSNIEIEIPNLVTTIDHYNNQIRSLKASYRKGSTEAISSVIFNYQQLTVADLKEMYRDDLIKIKWVENGENKQQEISISSLITDGRGGTKD